MSKHTKGPWHIGMRSGANSNLVFAHDGADQHHDTPICSVFGMYLHCDLHEQRDNEGLANARLIAAAPELLEALKVMTALCRLRYGNLDADVYAEIQAAEAIVKKAEGEQQ